MGSNQPSQPDASTADPQNPRHDGSLALSVRLPPELEARVPSVNFVEYYSNAIAGLMVWLDSEENEYRRRVLPLVELSPGLRLAVAAVSAQHGAAGDASSSVDFPEAARDACLSILQKSAGDLTRRLTTGADLNTGEDVVNAECMLASMLMMTCFEMAWSRVEAAECHRRAARTIVNIFGSTKGATGSRLFTFLRNQLAIHDVLAAATSFDIEDLKKVIIPAREAGEDLFTEYLSLLHRVIMASRDMAPKFPSMDAVRADFEQARASTVMAATRLRLGDSVVRRDFVRLVETYHNAALLYSYQCLDFHSLEPAPPIERIFLSTRLTSQLVQFEDETAWIQNLPWPALVAGFESHGNSHQQDTVANVFLSIFKATNSRHHMDTLDFLRTFWNGPSTDWRPQAKQWEDDGRRIIPV